MNYYLLISEYQTFHEKSMMIKRLKEGLMEEPIKEKYENICKLIKNMVSPYPSERIKSEQVVEKLETLAKLC